jgi:hypothetical protein
MKRSSNGIRLTVDTKQPIRETLRELIITGEFGQLWELYCHEEGIDDKIKCGFLDFLNRYIDGEDSRDTRVGQVAE